MEILYRAVRECESLLSELKIPYTKPTKMNVSPRMKRALGKCVKNGVTGEYEIRISSRIMRSDTYPALLQTVIHEYIHTCPGCMNHGWLWKAYADQVNRKTGLNIARLADSAEMGIEPLPEPKAAYRIKCERCGSTINRTRKSKAVLHPELYSCGECGGKVHSYLFNGKGWRKIK